MAKKVGRPVGPEGAKDCGFYLRMTKGQRDEIERIAGAWGLTVSSYLLRCAFGTPPGNYQVVTSSGMAVFGNGDVGCSLYACQEYIDQAIRMGSEPGFLSVVSREDM